MLSFAKIVLIVVIFNANSEHATHMREFNTVEECKVAAEAAMKQMATMPEIENGFAMCTGRVKLLTDDNGKELPIES
jgi:hypothetical protein